MGGNSEDCLDYLRKIEKGLAPQSIPLYPVSIKRVSEAMVRELINKKSKA